MLGDGIRAAGGTRLEGPLDNSQQFKYYLETDGKARKAWSREVA